MSGVDELTWQESKGSDGLTRIARDKNGNKRREEFTHVDGSRRIWLSSAAGKLSSFQEFSAKNLLRLERIYDDSGTERIAVGYFENSAKHFENDYDDRGLMTKQSKWNPSGRLLSVVHYLNNYRHGLYTQYSEDTGALIANEEYRNDARHGYCEQYFTTAGAETIKTRGHYANGNIEGPYFEFFQNGVMRESGLVENGKYEGERRRYFESGVVSQIMRYSAGEPHGALEEFYETGVTKRRLGMKSGKMHGLEQNFNAGGQLTSQNAYFEGASTKDLTPFQNADSTNEPLVLFHSNGEVQSRHERRDGIKHGPYETFRADGIKRSSGTFDSGLLSGPQNSYDGTGSLTTTTCFRADVIDGPRTSYFSSGEISKIENFQTGLLQSVRSYDSSGNIKSSVELDDAGAGLSRIYSPDGSLIRETEVWSNFSRDRQFRNGYDRVFGPSGLLWEGHFRSDLQEGLARTYSAAGVLKEIDEFANGRLTAKSICNDVGIAHRVLRFFDDGVIASDEIINESKDIDPLLRGSMIGPYEVIRSIGHGGMGDVVLAFEKALDRRVALKTIRGEADAESRARFESEGRALARIRHRNIVTVYSVFEHQGLPFLAMEYIEGWPLNTLLGQGLLGFNEQISLFRQMVEGMIAAHDANVLHRDLKPANLIVSKALDIKIIDFGISKILTDDTGLTLPNTALGTIRYMAPEVAMGLPASVATDIYSLGVILFEMLTGETPFNGQNQLETLELIKSAPVQFPEGISEILPDALKALVFKMTSKRIEERHSTLHEVLPDLAAISFEHLPAEFRIPMRPELGIANLNEARELLKKKGHNSSEFSLILNLASRIQQQMLADPDQTRPVGVVTDFVISPEALNRATLRYGEAKKELALSSNPRK
ncbi:hypothetical protein BH10BDE1_BH10BDE1_33380 [soil metagenome]